MRPSRQSPYQDQLQFDRHTFKALLPYLTEFKGRIALAMACLVLAKVSSVGLPIILKHIVDSLNMADPPALVIFPLGLLLAYGAARFANVLFGEIRDTLFGKVTERGMRRLALSVFRHLHTLDLSYHIDRQTGGLSRDIERGTSGLSFLLRFLVFNIVPTLLEIAFITILLLHSYSYWFALIIVTAVAAYIAYSVWATEWRTKYVRQANEADSSSNTRAIDSLINYETVKYFNKEAYEANAYDQALSAWEVARTKNRQSLFVLNSGQALIIAASLTAVMLLAAYQVKSDQMTIGDFVLINAYMMQIFLPLNFLGFVYREMKGSLANIERLFFLLKIKPGIKDAEGAGALQVDKGRIEFKNVSFSYNQEGRIILKNLSFSAKPGSKVAIVGASGAGKSTLSKLLYRFYECNSGQILIDGQNIQDVTLHSLRRAIGIVPQDAVLFNSTLEENLRYGELQPSDNDLGTVLKIAHLEHFVKRLPDGLRTQVGERGLKLSGGERQRVAIARTVLKNPMIWIFDEATSSLDSESEKLIVEAINEATENRTTIVIAHRLSTVVDADTILVLDDGKIVEQGTHEILFHQHGHYRKLWDLQQKKQLEDKNK